MALSLLMKCKTCYEFQRMVKQSEANGLYVTDLPPRVSEEDMYRFFGTFGRVADLYLADSGLYCLVNFVDREPVNILMHCPVQLYGYPLRIRPRLPPKDDNPRGILDSEILLNPEKIVKSLEQKTEFKTQVSEFLKEVEGGESVHWKQLQVCTDLENALLTISSTYKIQPFGSSVNGLAFKDSDLDIFYGAENENEVIVRDLFRKVRAVLEKLNFIESLNPIPQARVPIIKFIHKSTRLQCDLSFRNTMGVQNSKLVKFLLSLDERIKPFFMIIKYWAKLHKITGKRLSNYALVLLLINFIQSLNDPILPPLCNLQSGRASLQRIGVWSVGFEDDATKLRPISNNLPLEEIIGRFFESMLKTDFKSFVVSPIVGCLINRDTFGTPSKLPNEMISYITHLKRGGSGLKVDSVLCIQDPLELNLNVTSHVSHQDFQSLMDHCRIASHICHAVPPSLLLSQLLSTSFAYPPEHLRTAWLRNPMHERPLRPYMTFYVPSPPNLDDEISWRQELVHKITNIFKKVLKIHVENEKREKDVKPGSDQSLICKGSQVLWKDRDKMWNQWSPVESEIVDSEQSSSNEDVQVIQQIKKHKESSSPESQGNKRKRVEDDGNEFDKKRLRVESDSNKQNKAGNSNDVDVIDLDSDKVDNDKQAVRSIQEEISLSNDMVKRGHALPANQCILDFTCKISKGNSGACIELSDRRSRNSYFASLCGFLDEFLTRFIVEIGTS